jgi:hypothetical protein
MKKDKQELDYSMDFELAMSQFFGDERRMMRNMLRNGFLKRLGGCKKRL